MGQLLAIVVFVIVVNVGLLTMGVRFYRKVPPGKAAVKSGVGGLKAVFGSGVMVVPVMHRLDYVHTEAEAFTGKVDGLPAEILVQLGESAEDIKLAYRAFGGKDRDGTREVLQSIIDSSADADDLDARLAEVGYRRI